MRTTARSSAHRITSAAIAATALLVVATAVGGQVPKGEAAKGEKALTWGPAPAAFPAGAKMAVERGDPMKKGEFVVRLSLPADYKIPPHWHPTAEHVRVVSGEFSVGMGDTLEVSKTKKLAAGDTGTIAAKMHHFALTSSPTEISIRSEGPFAMTYVKPADDPRKKH
jgi:quercetin dioxygenase-like cupin family protein